MDYLSKKYGLLLLIALFFISVTVLTAQVTIGSGNVPEKFSTLQIEGEKMGLRLSRLTKEQRDALTLNPDAAGLMIFNNDTKDVEFYNGAVWKSFGGGFVSFGNGLSLNTLTNEVQLGGILESDVAINVKDNSFSILTNDGSFAIKDKATDTKDILKVTSTTISSNTINFTINDTSSDVFTIVEDEITNLRSVNVGSVLDINNQTLKASKEGVAINGKLTYANGSHGLNKVLTSNANGMARWEPLVSTTRSKPLPISILESSSQRPGNPAGAGTLRADVLPVGQFKTVTNTITLTSGKWFVSGVLYLYTYNQSTKASSNLNYTNIIRLSDETSKSIYVTGDQPESKAASTSAGGGSYSAIPLRHFITVGAGQEKKIRVDVMSHTTRTFMVRNVYDWLMKPNDGSFFQAIRVND